MTPELCQLISTSIFQVFLRSFVAFSRDCERLSVFPLKGSVLYAFLLSDCPTCVNYKCSCIDHFLTCRVQPLNSYEVPIYTWLPGAHLNDKSILLSVKITSVHIGDIADELHLGQRFLIDIKFFSDHLLFPGMYHVIHPLEKLQTTSDMLVLFLPAYKQYGLLSVTQSSFILLTQSSFRLFIEKCSRWKLMKRAQIIDT